MAIIRRDLAGLLGTPKRGEWTVPLPPDWYADALCAQVGDSEQFYPEKGRVSNAAKKVCLMCDVREECLEYALDNRERFGIWGGVSERDRRKIERDRRRAVA